MNNVEDSVPPGTEKPPVFATWTGWYALLIGVLIVLIGLFSWFTRHYA